MQTRKYTIRLFPTPTQEALLRQYLGARRFVWNWGLATIMQWHEAGEKLDWNRLCREFTVLRNKTEWMLTLYCHVIRSALYDLKIAMKAFFKRVKLGKAGFPRFKSRYDSKQGFLIPERSQVVNRRLVACKLRLKLARDIPAMGQVGAAVRIKRVANRWYVSFTVVSDPPEPTPLAPDNLVGIDIGFRKYAVISDGTMIINPRWTKQFARKLAHWQRKLARQKKGSNRRNKIKTRIAKIHAGIANRRKHYSHLISKQVAEKYDAACIETHSLKAQQQSRFAKSLSDVGHGHFRACLAYKLPDRGKQLLEADPYFPSSKTCHVCGLRHDLGFEEKWTCLSCNTTHDRDFNASKMLEHEGRRQVTADLLQTTDNSPVKPPDSLGTTATYMLQTTDNSPVKPP